MAGNARSSRDGSAPWPPLWLKIVGGLLAMAVFAVLYAQTTEIAGLRATVATQAAAQGRPATSAPPAASTVAPPTRAAPPTSGSSSLGTQANPYPRDSQFEVGNVRIKLIAADSPASPPRPYPMPHGKYVFVTCEGENLGKDTAYVILKLIDNQGRRFDSGGGLDSLAPNMPRQGRFYWDVPIDSGGLLVEDMTFSPQHTAYVSLGGIVEGTPIAVDRLFVTPTERPNSTPVLVTPTTTPVLVTATMLPLQRFVVANTGGDGAYLRRNPSQQRGANLLRLWPDGTVLIPTGESAQADGWDWYKVKDPAGNVGWVPKQYVREGP